VNNTTNLRKPTSSTTSMKTNSINKPSISSKSSINKPKLNTSVPSSNHVKQQIRSSSSSSSTNRPMNGHRPTIQNQMFTVQRLPTDQTINGQRSAPLNRTTNQQRSSLPNRTTNGQRSSLPNRMINGQRPSMVSCKLRQD
jgi:Tfp pilus assembly protein PilV